jgi:hypothetical protein
MWLKEGAPRAERNLQTLRRLQLTNTYPLHHHLRLENKSENTPSMACEELRTLESLYPICQEPARSPMAENRLKEAARARDVMFESQHHADS